LLRKAYDIQKSLEGEDSISCLPTLTLMANCYTKMKEYDVALEYIDNVTSKLINFLNVSSRSIPLLLPNMITNLKALPIPRLKLPKFTHLKKISLKQSKIKQILSIS